MSVQVLTPGVKPIQWNVQRDLVAPEWRWIWEYKDSHIFPFFASMLDAQKYPISSAANTGWVTSGGRGLAVRFALGDGVEQAIGGAYGSSPNLTFIASLTLRSGPDARGALFSWGASDIAPIASLQWEIADTHWRVVSNIVSETAAGTAVVDGTYTVVLTMATGGRRALWVDGALLIDVSNSYAGTVSTNWAIGHGVAGGRRLVADFHEAILLPTPIPDSVAQKISRAAWFELIRPDFRVIGKAPAAGVPASLLLRPSWPTHAPHVRM